MCWQGASAVALGGVAFSRFCYRALMEMTLAVVKVLMAQKSTTGTNLWDIFWGRLYDLRPEFEATVTERAMLSCAGARLLMGGGNPWADTLFYQCASFAGLTGDIYSFLMSLLVEVPMAKCVCVDSAGKDVASFVAEGCAKDMPLTLVPTLFSIANQIAGTARFERQNLACSSVVSFVKGHITTAMDRWFDYQLKSFDSVGSAVDYLMIGFDSDSGNCLDFEHDPHVVAIVPWPTDYFQRCSTTTICKKMCLLEWNQFQALKSDGVKLDPLTFTAESMFFPGTLDDSLKLVNATASLEIEASSAGCTPRASTVPPDFALAVAECSGWTLHVQVWCIPRQASATVYRVASRAYTVSLPGDMIQARFGSEGWLALLLIVGSDTAVYWVDNAGTIFQAPTVPMPARVSIVTISNLWVVEDAILVDVVTRYFDSQRSTAGVVNAMLLPQGLNSTWVSTSVNLMQFGNARYDYARLRSRGYLFLPLNYGFPAFRIEFARYGTVLSEVQRTMMSSASQPMPSLRLASASVSDDYSFATTSQGWNWLRQIRLDADTGERSGVFQSAPVTMSMQIQGHCDEISCEGCKDVATQRFCLAYNRCALTKCVGTSVNQRRPLCGLGGVVRTHGVAAIQGILGGWRIIAEMVCQILDVSFKGVRSVQVDWPEDAFLSHMCVAKDANAHLLSVITSFINAVLQLGGADVGYMFQAGSYVDKNADAALTITTTAMTQFMHQIFIAPLYFMAAAHQVLMCQISGVIALVDTTGFNLAVQPASRSADVESVAGQCLTIGTEVMTRYPQDNAVSLGFAVQSFMSNAVQMLMIQSVEPFLHFLDAGIAYAIGVIHSLGVLLMTQYAAKCNPPNFYLRTIVQCACDDHRLWIPEPSRSDSSYWCKGVLSMVDANNKPFYVYNPYSYREVQDLSSGLADYVQCASTSYSCSLDNPRVFEQQGVSVLNVLVKCRDNFVKKRWDPASFMLTDRKYRDKIRNLPSDVDFPVLTSLTEAPHGCGVANCLARVASSSSGVSVDDCMNLYASCVDRSWEDYWAYERSPRPEPEYTDACLVFSGPAALNITKFQRCVDGPEAGACSLPQHCWSPTSSNNVPVCEQHRLLSHGVNPDGVVQRLFSQARELVLQSVYAALRSEANVSFEFFSVEGDVLHQTMDCIFMGPYSRVNYWPAPVCLPGEECLDGPYWARDDAGGLSRGVDANGCSADSTLPYTCGSPARRAVMRFLVRDVLTGSGGENIKQILNLTLRSILDDWGDTGLYACDNCSSTYLPDRLSKPFTALSSDHVLSALEDDFAYIYRKSLESIVPWREYLGTGGYDWASSQRAQDEARFDPVRPVFQYDRSEAATPVNSSSMWDVCHASLRQVFFTLPVDEAGNVLGAEGNAYDGNSSRIEDFIRVYTQRAMLRSPLYWHYQPRHAPSRSAFFDPLPLNATESQHGRAVFDDYRAGSNLVKLLDGNSLPSFPVHGPRAFSLGLPHCPCGWDLLPLNNGTCVPPSEVKGLVCTFVPCDGVGFRLPDSDAVMARFEANWPCPETDVSAHWGFLDPDAQEAWLAAGDARAVASTPSEDLLRFGRSGLKIGSYERTRQLSKTELSPLAREVPLETARLKGPPPAWPEDLAEAFLDELFPAAHGAEESGVAAYCLRYAIEVARQVLLPDAQSPAQREVVRTWRVRCGSQLQLLHLCVTLDVFQPRQEVSPGSRQCPFFLPINDPVQGVYTTPECLVSVRGVFYDPCRCAALNFTCSAASSRVRLDLPTLAACPLRMDPRSLVRAEAPVGWWSAESQLNDWMSDPARLLREDDLVASVFADPLAVGNVQGDAWWSAEGPMRANSLLCDMVHDWWPEDWDFPVGYHVTVPCDSGDAAYRSFLQSFALGADGELVYLHDDLRDYRYVDSRYGAGGLCRSTNYGMPMKETNLMRYCTSVPPDGAEDFVLPRQRPSTGAWTDGRCTESSADLPWPAYAGSGLFDSAKVSVGTVPNMPWPGDDTYPASEQLAWPAGVAESRQWDLGCSDFELDTCGLDADCPAGYACRGRVCAFDTSRGCTSDAECGAAAPCQGVCASLGSVQCIMHADCPDGQMCTGVGTCRIPTIAVYNTVQDENVSFQLSTQGQCPAGSRNFSLQGASYWAYTGKDLMKMHGMCSFEDWYKYTLTSDRCNLAPASEPALRIDPAACPFWNLEATSSNLSMWWPRGNTRPELFFLRPTNCDRDYERLQGFAMCAPVSGARILGPDGETTSLTYDRFIRLHNATDGSVRLARMPFANNTDLGFLGLTVSSLASVLSDGDQPFLSCSVLAQCYASPFTVHGVRRNRTVAGAVGLLSRPLYDQNTVFKCGSFGLKSGDNCVLDKDVLPLYRYLCDQSTLIPACVSVVPDVLRLCASVMFSYEATNSERSSNLEALVELFYGFADFSELDGYIQVQDCMTQMHSDLLARNARFPTALSTGLYYPLMYVLHEVSFDWFYQCVVMGRARIVPGLRRSQDCAAFVRRASHTVDDYTPVSPSSFDDPMTYLRFLRGGYTRSSLQAYQSLNAANTSKAVKAAADSFKSAAYGSVSRDSTLPRCSRRRIWRVGPYGYDYDAASPYNVQLRSLIWNWYSTSTCHMDWQDALIRSLPPSLGVGYGNWTTVLTANDPAALVDQGGVSSTMLQVVQAFMQASVGISVLPQVGQKTQGCILFNTTMPSAYVGPPLPAELFPVAQSGSYMEVKIDDDSEPKTCAFLKDDDPLHKSASNCDLQNTSNGGTLRRCLSQGAMVTCTVIPKAFATSGKFGCGYDTAGGLLPSGCDEDGPSCAQDVVLPALYAQLRSRYVAPTGVAPLAAQVLPWFTAAGGGTWFGGLDLTPSLAYQQNIQPNPDKAVTCEINTDESVALKFSQCSNPHYQALKSHVDAYYRNDGSVVVPPMSQLEWPVSRGTMVSGVILAYASTNRSLRQRFVDALFDDATVCGDSSLYHVCWKTPQHKIVSVNPWHLGEFNPFSVCDVEYLPTSQGSNEYVYSYCNADNRECPAFNSRAVPMRCNPLFRQFVDYPGVPSQVDNEYLSYNLCEHTIEEDSDGCMNDQGLLGGFDGLPVGASSVSENMLVGTKYKNQPYSVASDLYTASSWAIPSDFADSGIYGVNPLWQGKEGPYGFVRAKDTDIGGHRVGLLVNRSETTGISTMTVWRLPLGEDEDGRLMLSSFTGRPASEWVQGLNASMLSDHEANMLLYGVAQAAQSGLPPSCPLQRWAFYSGSFRTFSPVLPSPKRARHLFRRVHGGAILAHPTMTKTDQGEGLGLYTTHNGFCACPVVQGVRQTQCLVSVATNMRCSLAETIASLQSGAWYESYVFAPVDVHRSYRRCTMQLDWPDIGNPLRDGSTSFKGSWGGASDLISKRCHVLDRLQPFRYRYKVADAMPPTILNANSAGACQFGRIASIGSWRPAGSRRCVRTVVSDARVLTSCADSFPRPARLTREDIVRKARTEVRRRCDRCSRPPRFTTTAGRPMPQPESSFGELYRVSAERMVAKGLREALCPSGDRASCDAVINRTAWRRGSFMRNLLTRPQWLVRPQAMNVSRANVTSPPPDDSASWTQAPWVYCPTTHSLMNGTGCEGAISREAWLRDRTGICPAMVKRLSISNGSARDPMSRTPFCNIDKSTSAVCEAIAEARQMVQQANCIRSGEPSCMPSPFVYHPVSYEPSNDAWVHDTVESFYRQIDQRSCPTTADGQALIDYNRRFQQSCPANSLKVFEGVLNIVRVVATDVVLVVTSYVSMALKVLALMNPFQVHTVSNLIMRDWVYIKSKTDSMNKVVSDLALDMILNSGSLGPLIVHYLQEVCTQINDAVRWMLRVWCDYITYYMINMLDSLRQFIGLSGSAFEILNDFMDEMLQGILPVSFFSKYGTKEFKKLMKNRYAEPTAHTDTVSKQTKVPSNVDVKPRSRMSRIRFSASKAIAKVMGSSALKAAGAIGVLVSAGMEAAQVADMIEGARLYPDNFTLIDTSEIVNVLDDFAKFIFMDGSCNAYRAAKDNGGYVLFPCLVLDIDKYQNTTAGTTSLDATLCW